tara:strand:+ start:8027 stop:9238 length:1212 start_codon:yes stop_codon:yes gene_type:complete
MQVPPFSLDKQLSEIGSELEIAVSRIIQSGHYIGGLEVKTFEDSFAKYLGLRNVVGCNSGTDALILALRALGIGNGDEVITPSFSFFATAEAISNVGATPVFVDIESNGYLIDIHSIEKAITSKTKAIMPVHLFGCPVDMDLVMELAQKFGLKVIEDCAQAAGAKWKNQFVGTFGDIGCFSFFPTKNLGAAGDGGAVTSNNDQLAKRIRELAVHGMPKRYLHTELGYNSRLDALQAAILNIKLPKLEEWVEKRKQVALRYEKFLKDLPGLEIPKFSESVQMTHGWNQFVIRVKNSSLNKNNLNLEDQIHINNDTFNAFPETSSRDRLKNELSNLGVNTIIYYPIPIHLQPAYNNLRSSSLASLPLTEEVCSEVLSLPIFPEITIQEQDYVIYSIKQILGQSNI